VGGGGVWTNVWGGVNMFEAQIYIKKHPKTEKNTLSGGGEGVISQMGGGYLPPPSLPTPPLPKEYTERCLDLFCLSRD